MSRPLALATAVLPAQAHWRRPSVSGDRRRLEHLRRRHRTSHWRELGSPSTGFLALDFAPGPAAARRALLAGDVIVEPMATVTERGTALDVPSALVHHWRGAVLIPKITVPQLVARLQDGAPPTKQEDVLQSRVLERKPDWMRVSLKLQRKKIITVVYNTEHVVTFVREGANRATSASTATRIVEVADVDTPREHELPAGDDRGFLWRLNAHWRYQQTGDGVIAECESITLSRDIPSVAKWFVMPLVERAARESMTRTLVSLRARFAG
jgi:hypothetical protein